MTQSRARLWIPVFIAINLLWRLPGNPNPGSRLATMAAMTERRTFKIDPYVIGPAAWTNDWARTPDGHYYSNKAPGPMLLGWPVFALVDAAVTHGIPDASERDLRRRARLPDYNIVLCLMLQILPMAAVTAWALRWLSVHHVEPQALHFAALAMLFGQTAALLMNTFFGHGFTAVAWLIFALALAEIRPVLAGAGLGLAVLGDYGSLAVAVPALLVWARRTRGQRSFWPALIGGATLPAIAWGIYHTACFGAPWTIALHFQNPEFVDAGAATHSVLGLFHGLPEGRVLYELLVGPSRSLLITCPWIFVVLAALWLERHRLRADPGLFHIAVFGAAGLLMLLGLNASFGGWHGGRMIGPRYLSPLLPVWGLIGGAVLSRQSRWIRGAAWAALGISLVLAYLVFHTTLYVLPGAPLWPSLWQFYLQAHA